MKHTLSSLHLMQTMGGENMKNQTYRKSISKTGCFAPHINPDISARIDEHCRKTKTNKTRFVEWCCEKGLAEAERDTYLNMSKEMLVDLILKGGK